MPSAAELPVRHPPEPKKPENMVDSQPSAAAQHRPHHLAQRRETGLGQPVRPPRRQPPVLALLVETVRRGADAEAGRQLALQRPRVRSARIDPDGQVVHDADAHAARRRRPLRCRAAARRSSAAASGETPTRVGELGPRRVRPRGRAGPEAPRASVRQSAPCRSASAHQEREIVERRAVFGVRPLLGHEPKSSSSAADFAAQTTSRSMRSRHRNAGGERVDASPHLERGGRVFRQQFGPQVQRRAEPPRGREVRRVLDRARRERRRAADSPAAARHPGAPLQRASSARSA